MKSMKCMIALSLPLLFVGCKTRNTNDSNTDTQGKAVPGDPAATSPTDTTGSASGSTAGGVVTDPSIAPSATAPGTATTPGDTTGTTGSATGTTGSATGTTGSATGTTGSATGTTGTEADRAGTENPADNAQRKPEEQR